MLQCGWFLLTRHNTGVAATQPISIRKSRIAKACETKESSFAVHNNLTPTRIAHGLMMAGLKKLEEKPGDGLAVLRRYR